MNGKLFKVINNLFNFNLILLIEIMLKDPNFNLLYAYTGLISQTKQLTNAYWMPRNISVRVFFIFNIYLSKNKLNSIIVH